MVKLFLFSRVLVQFGSCAVGSALVRLALCPCAVVFLCSFLFQLCSFLAVFFSGEGVGVHREGE